MEQGNLGPRGFGGGGSRRLRGEGGCRNGSAGWTGPIGIVFRFGSKKGTFRMDPKYGEHHCGSRWVDAGLPGCLLLLLSG